MGWLSKRGRRPTLRMDASDLKHILHDERVWCVRAKVFQPPDASSHWRVDTKGGVRRVLVEVTTLPGGHDLTCRLAPPGAGQNTGLWFIPKVGTVVLVCISDGEIDGYPVIVGVEDSGGAPNDIGPDVVMLAAEKPFVARAPEIKLGDIDASEAVVKGTTFWMKLNVMTSGLISACDLLQLACKGPLAAFLPGVLAMRAAFVAFQQAGSNEAYLSKVSKTK